MHNPPAITKISLGMTWTTVCDRHLVEIAQECTKLDVDFTSTIGLEEDETGLPCRVCVGDNTTEAIARTAYEVAVIQACN